MRIPGENTESFSLPELLRSNAVYCKKTPNSSWIAFVHWVCNYYDKKHRKKKQQCMNESESVKKSLYVLHV